MVDESALLIKEYIDMTGSNMMDSPIFTGFVGSPSSPISVTFQRARELICDAVACLVTIEELRGFDGYLQTMKIFDKGRSPNRPLPAEKFSWSPCDFLFLATCFLGDIDAVQHSLKMTSNVPRNLQDTERLRFVGLYVAVRRDHRKLISFFLKSGVEVSKQNWCYVLCAAVQTGNIYMLQHFLTLGCSEQRDMNRLCCVLGRAAEYTDTTVRIEMCRLLLAFWDLTDIDVRTGLLLAACRSNDVVFADWIIGTGPVKLYDKRTRDGPLSLHPLFIAVNHGSTDVIRLLLKSKFEVYQDTDQYIIEEIFFRAQDLGRFDIFMDLVPYLTRLSREDILEHAAAVDHALEAVDKSLGLAEVTPAETSRTEKAFDCSRMMKTAVEYQLISNIEWLLNHGFRTETVVKYQLDCSEHGHGYGHKPKFKPRKAIFQDLGRIQALFGAYNNPGIELRCSYHCKSPTNLEEVMRLQKPWEYECVCGQKL